MKKLKANTAVFSTGAVGYGLLELLWRGRTHPSMLLAGGICFLLFGHIRQKSRILHFLAGAVSVTAVELLFGIIFNLLLKKNVWDYSRLPLNFLGQICLPFSVLWGMLAIPCIPLARRIYNRF